MQEKLYIISADDDADDQDFLEFALKSCDCGEPVLDRVANGEKLLELLYKIKSDGLRFPDLVLLDLNMPVKNGKEALGILNSDPALKKYLSWFSPHQMPVKTKIFV